MADGGIGRRIVIVLVILAVAIAAFFIYVEKWGGRRKPPPTIEKVPGETRSVTFFFAGKEADRLITESREIPVQGGLEEQIRSVVEEFLKGPEKGEAVSAVPPETKLIQAFWVEDKQTAYLDFNQALVSNHPGGSTAEYYTITTILKTIKANFPQVRFVQFLVEGYPVETIAGHYAVDKPIELDRWR